MILSSDNVKRAHEIIMKVKTISKPGVTVVDLVDYFTTINKINSLEYGDLTVNGNSPVSKYKIPDQLKELVQPSQLQIEVGNDSVNLRAKEYYSFKPIVHTYQVTKDDKLVNKTHSGRILNAEEFTDISIGLQGVRRAQSDDKLVGIDTLVIRSSITDNVSKFASTATEMCHDNGSAFVPMLVSTDFKKNSWYNLSIDDMFADWFRQQMLKF